MSAVRECLLSTFATTATSGGHSFIRSLRKRQAMGTGDLTCNTFEVTKNMQQNETQQHICAVTSVEISLDSSQTYKYLRSGNQLTL